MRFKEPEVLFLMEVLYNLKEEKILIKEFCEVWRIYTLYGMLIFAHP